MIEGALIGLFIVSTGVALWREGLRFYRKYLRRPDPLESSDLFDRSEHERHERHCLACGHARRIHAQGMDAEQGPICLVTDCPCEFFVGCDQPAYAPMPLDHICMTCGASVFAHAPQYRGLPLTNMMQPPEAWPLTVGIDAAGRPRDVEIRPAEPRPPRPVEEDPDEAHRETVPPTVREPLPPRPVHGSRRIHLEN